MMGWPMAQSQQEGTVEPHNNVSVLKMEEQADANEGRVILDYKPGIESKPEGTDPNDEPDTQKKEEKKTLMQNIQKRSYISRGFLDSRQGTIKCKVGSDMYM